MFARRSLFPFALVVISLPAPAQGRSAALTVLTGATVIDVERGVRVPAQDIVLQGDRIIAVRRSGSVSYPSGTRLIGARGRYVIPGLWDMHTHLTVPPWVAPGLSGDSTDDLSRVYFTALLTASGITGVRDLAGDLRRLQLWERTGNLDRSGPPVPRILATGQKLGAEPVLPGAPFPVRTPEDVRKSVRVLHERGAAHVKLMPAPPAWMSRAAMEACRAEGIPCVAHVPDGMPVTDAAEGGMKSLEHLFLLHENTSSIPFAEVSELRRAWLEPTLLERVSYRLRLRSRPDASVMDTALSTHSPSRGARVFGQLAASGTWLTPTLTLHDMILRVAPRHAAGRDTSLMTEPPRTGELAARSPGALDLATRRWRGFLELVRELNDAGVPLLAGTDIPLQSVPGFSLHMELEHLQSAGLTPVEALRTATLNPARYLGAVDTLGSVAAGRVADLVVLREDPLLDVAAVESVELVVTRGRVSTRRELDALIEQARAALRALRDADEPSIRPPGE